MVQQMNYFDELKRSMEWLSTKSNTVFIGQAVGCAGTGMSNTLKDIDALKRIELPVFEELQMGMSLGMALEGFVPVSVFPRWNFLLCAMSGLVNHIDKYPLISDYRPKVIIRTGIGSVHPLDPQWQHKGDFTDAVQKMCRTVKVIRLDKPEQIFPAYVEAYNAEHSTILCEVSDFLNEDFRIGYDMFRETCQN
jgi:pyruvate/2-oxoglutarate/acetoin dehydrogenase E1 component